MQQSMLPLLSKKNTAARLRFAMLHLKKAQDFWNDVWTKCTAPHLAITKHISARRWRSDDLGLVCSHRTWVPCSHSLNHKLLCIPTYSRMSPSTRQLKFGWNWVKHQDSDRHIAWLTKKRIKLLQQPTRSLDLMPKNFNILTSLSCWIMEDWDYAPEPSIFIETKIPGITIFFCFHGTNDRSD